MGYFGEEDPADQLQWVTLRAPWESILSPTTSPPISTRIPLPICDAFNLDYNLVDNFPVRILSSASLTEPSIPPAAGLPVSGSTKTCVSSHTAFTAPSPSVNIPISYRELDFPR